MWRIEIVYDPGWNGDLVLNILWLSSFYHSERIWNDYCTKSKMMSAFNSDNILVIQLKLIEYQCK